MAKSVLIGMSITVVQRLEYDISRFTGLASES